MFATRQLTRVAAASAAGVAAVSYICTSLQSWIFVAVFATYV